MARRHHLMRIIPSFFGGRFRLNFYLGFLRIDLLGMLRSVFGGGRR
jgi:hypothetical protein